MKSPVLLLILIVLSTSSCKKKSLIGPGTDPPVSDTFFAKGADVSWVTQMESEGVKFYNRSGVQQDLFQVLKEEGMNSIRLRVWVNPANGWCGTDDVVTKALRAKAAGMKIMIDFHYSDSWADPGKQNKPAAWKDKNIDGLISSLSNYTKSVLTTLQSKGITPDWVQVGNETDDGMLWPDGQASKSMSNFAKLITTGYDAVKSVFPKTKVIVHISNGADNAHFRWIFDGLKNNNAKWDVIGMSLYPDASSWSYTNSQCLSNINDMISRYDREIMICEVGMSVSDSLPCKNFILDLIRKTKSVAGHKCLGVFYWEPECYADRYGYKLGAFNSSGQPTIALDAFE